MNLAQAVLATAANKIGYQSGLDPEPGSLPGRWAAQVSGQQWLAGPSRTIAWCDLFVSWVFAQAGAGPAIGVEGKTVFAWTVAHLNWFKARGRLVPLAQAQPGDVIFYDWNLGKGAPTEHVGIVEKYLGNGRVQTIEGNTSSGVRGSQTHGGGVWRRVRTSTNIVAVCRPVWEALKNNQTPQETTKTGEETMFTIQTPDDGKVYLVQDGAMPLWVNPTEWSGIAKLGLRAVVMTASEFANFQTAMKRALADEAKAQYRVKVLSDILTDYQGAGSRSILGRIRDALKGGSTK